MAVVDMRLRWPWSPAIRCRFPQGRHSSYMALKRPSAHSIWGIGTVGSALRSHRRGQGFESPMLHQVSRAIGELFCNVKKGSISASLKFSSHLICNIVECFHLATGPYLTGLNNSPESALIIADFDSSLIILPTGWHQIFASTQGVYLQFRKVTALGVLPDVVHLSVLSISSSLPEIKKADDELIFSIRRMWLFASDFMPVISKYMPSPKTSALNVLSSCT